MATRRRLDREGPAQFELAPFPLDIEGGNPQVTRRLIAGNDAANRRRDADIHLADRLGDQGRQGLAQTFGPVGILEDQVLLQEGAGVQPAGQDEVTLTQGACAAEFVEDLFGVHG